MKLESKKENGRGKKQDAVDAETIERETPEPDINIVIDPYETFRYQKPELPPVHFSPLPRPRGVPVLKKWEHPGSAVKAPGKHGSRDNRDNSRKAGKHDCLSTEVSDPPPLPVWKSSKGRIGEVVSQAIYYPEKMGAVYKRALRTSDLKEWRALQHFSVVRNQQLEMENHCIRGTQKARESLLLRKGQFLPHLTQAGKEMTKVQRRVYHHQKTRETPATAFFLPTQDRNRRCEKELDFQLTKDQLGCKFTTKWVGYPEVTDEIRNDLNLNTVYQASQLRNMVSVGRVDDNELPYIANLGVVGVKYSEIQRRLHEATVRTRKERKSARKSRITSVDTNSLTDLTDERTLMIEKEKVESKVSLSIVDVKLRWSSVKCSKKERVIELGCTARIGTSAVNWISMKNTGTAAIEFNWAKREKADTFELRKLDQIRVIFDSSGGVILPSETYRLPFMYKAITPGYYSEDWLLITRPVLENGAPVVLRLWGFSREFDPFSLVRARFDETLKGKVIEAICRNRVDKIVDYLPIKETTLNETRFPTIYGGPDLFAYHNPWLNYHSGSVYRLGKLYDMIKAECSPVEPASSEEGEEEEEEEEHTDGDERASRFEEIHHKKKKKASTITSSSLSSSYHSRTVQHIWTETSPDHIPIYMESDSSVGSHLTDQPKSDDRLEKKEKKGRSKGGPQSERLESLKPRRKRNLTNVIDPSIVVNTMRSDLMNCDVNGPFQEAAFEVMSTVVDRLHFKTYLAGGNWKLVMCRGLLANAMEMFSEYANHLQQSCCVAERESAKIVIEKTESVVSDQPEESESILVLTGSKNRKQSSVPEDVIDNIIESKIGTVSPESEESLVDVSDTSSSCETRIPRVALDFRRYQNIYYSSLQIRMYQLLQEFCDKLDFMLGGPPSIFVDWESKGFTKVRRIPWNIEETGLLTKQPPPRWITIAQRIGHTEAVLRHRKQEVEEWARAHQQQQQHDDHEAGNNKKK